MDSKTFHNTIFREVFGSLLGLILLFTHNLPATDNQEKYTITGRVINKQGYPVSNAQVFLRLLKMEKHGGDDLVVMTRTNSQGQFRLEEVSWSAKSLWHNPKS